MIYAKRLIWSFEAASLKTNQKKKHPEVFRTNKPLKLIVINQIITLDIISHYSITMGKDCIN